MATNTLYDLKFAGNPTTNAARLKTLAHGGPLVVAMDHALASFSYDPPARPCKFVFECCSSARGTPRVPRACVCVGGDGATATSRPPSNTFLIPKLFTTSYLPAAKVRLASTARSRFGRTGVSVNAFTRHTLSRCVHCIGRVSWLSIRGTAARVYRPFNGRELPRRRCTTCI